MVDSKIKGADLENAFMFGLFKKRPAMPPAGEPHPQHRNFARMFIPDALTRHRSGFLAAMSDGHASQTLQESWQRFGAGVLPPGALMPPAGLSVSGFQHNQHLCFFILFPPPQTSGESHFGFIVAGPSEDWSPDARAKVPVRYFLLERSAGDMPAIFEWRPSNSGGEEIFDACGPGPSPANPPDFVEAILSRHYGLKPGA